MNKENHNPKQRRNYLTQLNPLTLALRFITEEGISSRSVAERHGLRASTLVDIGAGKDIARSREKYMQAFVCELNSLRRSYRQRGDETKEQEMTRHMADLLLVYYNFATDAEIDEMERRNRFIRYFE